MHSHDAFNASLLAARIKLLMLTQTVICYYLQYQICIDNIPTLYLIMYISNKSIIIVTITLVT